MPHRALLAGLLLILWADAADAQYMDPGATSLVVQLVIAGVVGLAAVLKLYWRKIAGLFRRGTDGKGGDRE